jgi:pimeloyl-ACP methyl ester carboxylesterase
MNWVPCRRRRLPPSLDDARLGGYIFPQFATICLHMASFSDIGSWISVNESLLSGLAAMIVVGGVAFSAVGIGYRRLADRQGSRSHDARAGDPKPDPVDESSRSLTDSSADANVAAVPTRLTFKMLTAPSPHETKFADSQGLRIAYNERGTGPPTVVCAPGIISHLNITANLPVTRNTYASLAEFAHVIAFDKRGQGLSDPTMSSPNLEERTNDIEAVMDDAGVDRCILLGVSEGGPMCLHFAHSHPERVQGLVLVGTTARWVQSEDYPIGIAQGDLEKLPRAWGRGTLRDVFFPSISREEIDNDTYKSFENLISSPDAIHQIVEMMIGTDVRPLLSEICLPTLIVHFTGDLAVPIRLGRYLADHMPNAEFLEVNAVDHVDIAQSPEAVARIRAFCERVAGEE